MSKTGRMTVIYCFVCLGIVFSTGSFAETGERKDAKALFLAAQETFKRAQTQQGEQKNISMLKAANQFEALVEKQEIENGYLFYNIGNCYYEAGERGKAILYYLKAKRLIPGFSDLNYNLTLAREELKLPEIRKTWWEDIVKGILFWHYMLDYSTRRTVFILAFAFIWLFLTVAIFFNSFLLRGGLVVSLLTTLLFGGSYLASAYQVHFVASGVITAQEAVVRKGPGTTYETFYEQPLPGGTAFELLETQGEWWKIRLYNNESLWINAHDAGSI